VRKRRGAKAIVRSAMGEVLNIVGTRKKAVGRRVGTQGSKNLRIECFSEAGEAMKGGGGDDGTRSQVIFHKGKGKKTK